MAVKRLLYLVRLWVPLLKKAPNRGFFALGKVLATKLLQKYSVV
jgi:hypothetical protein